MFWSRSRRSAEAPAQPTDEDACLNEVSQVAAARADPRAFAPLYERYLGPIYRYCYTRLGSREAAEDATSEVFLKALAGLNGYRGGVFVAWLFRIAQNVVVDAYRRHRTTQPLEAVGALTDPAQGPEDTARAHAEREALRTALAMLSDEQRTVLELQLAGWSGTQIAAALGTSPAAVKMHRYRAINRLRQILKEAGWDLKGAEDE